MHSIKLRHPDGYRQICLQAPKYAVKACKALSASTRLNKIFILFNRIYFFKVSSLPAGIDGFMVADRLEEVKIEQNRNQFFSSGFSAKRESIFSSQRDCLHQPISIIKNPAMKIAVRAADAGEITQDATNPVPALVKK